MLRRIYLPVTQLIYAIGMGPKILVVDDDVTMVHMVRETLEHEGYSVIVGYDGQMALTLAKAQKPNLIVMDVQMPMTSGIKALEFLRRNTETQHIPVVFLSGAPSDMVYSAVDAHTRVVFLKKPLDIENLYTTIRDLLLRYQPA